MIENINFDRSLFTFVKIVIIDEYSSIGAEMLLFIDSRLKKIIGNYHGLTYQYNDRGGGRHAWRLMPPGSRMVQGCLRDVIGEREREREKYSPSFLLLDREDIHLWVATLVVARGT